METSGREKAGLIALVVFTALVMVSCVQPKQPPSAGITFRDAPGSAPVSPARSPSAPSADNATPSSAAPAADAPAANTSAPPAADIVVHVTGAVKKPGVYHFSPGARGDDALKAAGGPTADANPDALNLAAHLEDGSQIHVPTRKEQAANPAPPAPDSFVKHDPAVASKSEKPAGKPGAPHSATHAGHSGAGGASAKLKPDSGVKINLNTADAQTLQKLPGIGPSMADRILEYRKTNGGFKNPEELMEVSGIGPKKYAKLESLVKVK